MSTTDNEREALARAHFDAWRAVRPGTLTWETFGEPHKQRFYDAADVALAAGFHRQGPVTDEVEALKSAGNEVPGWMPGRDRVAEWLWERAAALEAARNA